MTNQPHPARNATLVTAFAAAFTALAIFAGLVLGLTVTDDDTKPVVPLVPIILAAIGFTLGLIGRQHRSRLANISAIVSGVWCLLWFVMMIGVLAEG